MKRYLVAFLLACTLALPGCVSMPPGASGVAVQADKVILTGQRAFGVAELTYTTAADGVGVLVDNGVIRGAAATKARAWNATARGLLVQGKATADAAEKARIAARLLGIAADLNTLKGSN